MNEYTVGHVLVQAVPISIRRMPLELLLNPPHETKIPYVDKPLNCFKKSLMFEAYPELQYESPPSQQDTFDTLQINYTINECDIISSSLKIITEFFPDWSVGDIQYSTCTTGLTNKLLKLEHKSKVVLVRVYGRGTDILINRNQEMMNMFMLSRLGYAPEVYGYFNNGMVYGFAAGQVFTPKDMVDEHKSVLVSRHVAAWHSIDIQNEKPQLFVVMKRWLQVLEKNKVLSKTGYSFAGLKKEATVLQRKLESLKSPVVFCHSDLQVGNIIYDPETDYVNFIDHEYGCVSYRGFDIGNHFCEFGGPSGDWSKYPDKEFQSFWLKHYLHSTGVEVTVDVLESLIREVNAFALASHFFWAIWGFIQAEISDIDFDYVEYAQSRLSEYYDKRDSWLP